MLCLRSCPTTLTGLLWCLGVTVIVCCSCQGDNPSSPLVDSAAADASDSSASNDASRADDASAPNDASRADDSMANDVSRADVANDASHADDVSVANDASHADDVSVANDALTGVDAVNREDVGGSGGGAGTLATEGGAGGAGGTEGGTDPRDGSPITDGDTPDASDGGDVEHDAARLDPASAQFSITQDGQTSRYVWSAAAGNLVRCGPDGAMHMIRLALETVRDGENGLHLDFDVCAFTPDGGIFPGRDPFTTPCEGTPHFDVFWHDTSQPGVFVNKAGSTPCTLALSASSHGLVGHFRCDHLSLPNATTPSLNVEGDFACPPRD